MSFEEIQNLLADISKKIDEVALDEISDNSETWEIGEDNTKLTYTLAYNDGILAFARRLKMRLKGQQPEKFKVEDETDQGTDQSF